MVKFTAHYIWPKYMILFNVYIFVFIGKRLELLHCILGISYSKYSHRPTCRLSNAKSRISEVVFLIDEPIPGQKF